MSDIESNTVLRARRLRKEYGRDAGLVRAVDNVDLDVAPGETLAVMGPGRRAARNRRRVRHLLRAEERHGPTTIVPTLWLAVVVAGTLLAVGVLTAIPASIGARRSAAEVLQAETR